MPTTCSLLAETDSMIQVRSSGRMTGRVTFNSCVQGYPDYNKLWNPTIWDSLTEKPEFGNPYNPYAGYAVAVVIAIVGQRMMSELPQIKL